MQQRVRVKICGITQVNDALSCVAAGADAIGLVFYAPSPRHVEIAQARQIVAALPPFVTPVGLFVDAEAAAVEAVLANVPLGLLQFHGEETPEFCAGFGRPYIKAVRVRDRTTLEQACAKYAGAQGILADAYVEGLVGGTGQAFDWHLATGSFTKNIILAGGLNPGNVAQAIRQVQPYAVDVSGGVERSKGIKDADKIQLFMQEVQGGNDQ